MLRKAFKRSGQDQGPQMVQKIHDQDVVGDVESKRKKNTDQKELEEIVFTDSKDIIEKMGVVLKKKKTKSMRKKYIDKEIEVKSAWVDDYEKTTKSGKVGETPQWAKLKSQREDDDDGELESTYLQSAGDLLVKPTALPSGMLQIKKLSDANADDTRQGRIQNVEFHPAAKVILTAGTSHRLNLFQLDGRTNPKIQSIFFEDFPIHTAHFSSDGDEVIVGSDRKNLKYYNMIAGKVVNVPKMKGLEGSNMARFEVSPDGRFLAFLGRYGSIHIISAKSKEWITTVKMNGDIRCLTFSKDGSKMFSFGDNSTVFVWDMNSRTCVHTFIDEGCVHGTSIAASPNNQYIACGSQSGIVNIYDQDTCLQESSPKPLKSIMNLTTVCNKVKFNCSSEILACASDEDMKAIKLVHFPSMHVFANFPELMDRQLQIPKCLDFSPNGGYMAIGNQKGYALLYRLSHFSTY